jgi:hypothetical protein
MHLKKVFPKQLFFGPEKWQSPFNFSYSKIAFFRRILSQRYVYIFEISVKIRIFWYPYWPISRKKKKFWPSDLFNFLERKMPFSQKMAKYKEKRIL